MRSPRPSSGFTLFLAALCAVIFSLSAAAVLVALRAEQTLLSPGPYKNALITGNVYPELPELVSEQLVLALNRNPCSDNPLRCPSIQPQLADCFESVLGPWRTRAISAGVEKPSQVETAAIQTCIDQLQPDVQAAAVDAGGGVLAFLQLIRAQDLEKVITPLLPPPETQALADSLLDQSFAYLHGRQAQVTLNLTGLKTALKSPGGLDTFLLILRSQPPCTFDQLQQLLVITLTGQGSLALCSPVPELLDLLTPFIQTQLAAAVDTLPDNEALTPLQVGASRSFGPFGDGAVGAFRLALTLLRLSSLVPLLFLLLVTLLAVRTVRDFLRWWGIPLLGAGLLVLPLGLLGEALFEPAWVGLLSGRLPDTLSVGLVGTAHDVVRAVLQTFWGGSDLLGGIVAAIGLAMWIVSAFIHPGCS